MVKWLDEKERERETGRAHREQEQQQQQKEGGEHAFGGHKAAAVTASAPGEFDAEGTAVGAAETDSEQDTDQARIRRDWATAGDTDADVTQQQLHREGVGTISGVGY